jgi:hypothetical protein
VLVQSQLISILNDVLNQQGKSRKGRSQLIFHCPFCTDKNLVTQKLEIAINGPHIGYYHCWRCNTKGRTFGTLLKKLKAPQHYRDELYKLTGDIRLFRNYFIKFNKSEVALPEEFLPLTIFRDNPEYRNAMVYLKKRRIIPEDIVRYNIGYCETGLYANHVIVPSYDAKGSLNFFIGRRYYKNDPGMPYKKPDVSMDTVGFESFINYNEPLILVESVFNAITIRRNAIPLFGKYPSKKLYEAMIVNNVKKVYVFLDSDAEKDALFVCKQLLKLGIIPCFVSMNGGKDPNEIGFNKSWKCIEDAKEVDDCFLLKKGLEL